MFYTLQLYKSNVFFLKKITILMLMENKHVKEVCSTVVLGMGVGIDGSPDKAFNNGTKIIQNFLCLCLQGWFN